MKRKKIGLLGGNFNPVHQAHLVMAQAALQQLSLDCVFFLPENLPPHVDEKATIAPVHRVAMLELALAPFPKFGLELCEIERGGKSYTYDTVKFLTANHPDTDYFFIIGSDMVNYLPTWYKIDELIKLVHFVAVRRTEKIDPSVYPVQWIDAPLITISSTQIRKTLARHGDVSAFLPQTVLNYIQSQHLYQKKEA